MEAVRLFDQFAAEAPALVAQSPTQQPVPAPPTGPAAVEVMPSCGCQSGEMQQLSTTSSSWRPSDISRTPRDQAL